MSNAQFFCIIGFICFAPKLSERTAFWLSLGYFVIAGLTLIIK